MRSKLIITSIGRHREATSATYLGWFGYENRWFLTIGTHRGGLHWNLFALKFFAMCSRHLVGISDRRTFSDKIPKYSGDLQERTRMHRGILFWQKYFIFYIASASPIHRWCLAGMPPWSCRQQMTTYRRLYIATALLYSPTIRRWFERIIT
jgi:hypothetical protein